MDSEKLEKLYELAITAYNNMDTPSFSTRLLNQCYFDAFTAAIAVVTGHDIPKVIAELSVRIRNQASPVDS